MADLSAIDCDRYRFKSNSIWDLLGCYNKTVLIYFLEFIWVYINMF